MGLPENRPPFCSLPRPSLHIVGSNGSILAHPPFCKPDQQLKALPILKSAHRHPCSEHQTACVGLLLVLSNILPLLIDAIDADHKPATLNDCYHGQFLQ